MMKVLWWKENLHYGCRCRVLRSLADIYSSNLSPSFLAPGTRALLETQYTQMSF